MSGGEAVGEPVDDGSIQAEFQDIGQEQKLSTPVSHGKYVT
jgi:hypothetical protein